MSEKVDAHGPSWTDTTCSIGATQRTVAESERNTIKELVATIKNPKDAIAGNKVPVHLFPDTAIVLGAMGMLDGREKYGENNFLATPVSASVYLAAARRHLMKLQAGVDNDEDTGLPQECYILACMAIYCDAKYGGTLVDDRRFNGTHLLKVFADMTPHVQRLKQLHAGKNPKHYTIADTPTK